MRNNQQQMEVTDRSYALNLLSDGALAGLRDARLAIVGPGALGGHLALPLARCGLQGFTVVDSDLSELGNRPFLPVWGRGELGRPRQERFGAAMRAANSALPYLDLFAGDWGSTEASIIYSRRAQLDGPSLDPAELVLYSPDQYSAALYYPYEETSTLGWMSGRSLASGQPVYLRALATFMSYEASRAMVHLFPVTLNGLAAGPSLVHAILAAAYEVLERDAFMIAWFARLPTHQIDPRTHPDAATRAPCQVYRQRGIEIGLRQLPISHPCAVFRARGVQQASSAEPAVIVRRNSSLVVSAAICKAILKVDRKHPSHQPQARIRKQLSGLVDAPQRFTTIGDQPLVKYSACTGSTMEQRGMRGNWWTHTSRLAA